MVLVETLSNRKRRKSTTIEENWLRQRFVGDENFCLQKVCVRVRALVNFITNLSIIILIDLTNYQESLFIYICERLRRIMIAFIYSGKMTKV